MANIDLSKVMNLADAQEIYKDLRDRIKTAGTVKDVTVGGTSVVNENGIAVIVLPTVPVSDVQVNGDSILSNGVANIPKADYGVYGVVKTGSGYGVSVTSGSSGGTLMISGASDNDLKAGTSTYKPITAASQHKSVFYALSKLAGVDLEDATVTVGTYPDSSKQAIQKLFGLDGILGDFESSAIASKAYAIGETFVYNGKRYRATAAIAIGDVIAPGTNCALDPLDGKYVRDTDIASTSTLGLVMVNPNCGITLESGTGKLYVSSAISDQIKSGTNAYRPIVPGRQHESAFYGLAKAAGDTTQSQSDNAVGTYTAAAKTAIQTMLGIEADIPLVETVTGATASITGMPNVRYICDTAISELTITPPASGSIVVRFTAGSNCIVSLPQTVKLPEWFDISSLEVGTTYEIIITDGVYGGVMSWA